MPRAEAVQQRVAEVAGRAGERGRMTVRDRAERLRQVAPAILQTAIGAGVAWLVARHVIGHPRPFFAPISAIIALGVVLDQRTRRAVEIVLGVAFGVLVADGIVIVLGTGAAQIALVVTLAMAGAVVLGGRRLIITQAATSAVLVTTLGVPGSFNFARPIDAVVGGATALTIHLLVLPLDPRRIVRRRLDPLLGALSGAIDRVAAAVAARDAGAIEDAQESARQIDDPMGRYAEAVSVGAETARLAPLRRRARPELDRHAHAVFHLDQAGRNVRVLARAGMRAIGLEAAVPEEELRAMSDLSRSVRALGSALDERSDPTATRELALRAVSRSAGALEQTGNLSVSVLTGQIRSIAVDVLRAAGEEDEPAVVAVREAAERPVSPAPPPA